MNQKIKETFSERDGPSFLNHPRGLPQKDPQVFLTPSRYWKALSKANFMAILYGSCIRKSSTIRRETLKAPLPIAIGSFTELAISSCKILFVLSDQRIGSSQIYSLSKTDSGLLCHFLLHYTMEKTLNLDTVTELTV